MSISRKTSFGTGCQVARSGHREYPGKQRQSREEKWWPGQLERVQLTRPCRQFGTNSYESLSYLYE